MPPSPIMRELATCSDGSLRGTQTLSVFGFGTCRRWVAKDGSLDAEEINSAIASCRYCRNKPYLKREWLSAVLVHEFFGML